MYVPSGCGYLLYPVGVNSRCTQWVRQPLAMQARTIWLLTKKAAWMI